MKKLFFISLLLISLLNFSSYAQKSSVRRRGGGGYASDPGNSASLTEITTVSCWKRNKEFTSFRRCIEVTVLHDIMVKSTFEDMLTKREANYLSSKAMLWFDIAIAKKFLHKAKLFCDAAKARIIDEKVPIDNPVKFFGVLLGICDYMATQFRKWGEREDTKPPYKFTYEGTYTRPRWEDRDVKEIDRFIRETNPREPGGGGAVHDIRTIPYVRMGGW